MVHFHQMVEALAVADDLSEIQLAELAVGQNLDEIADAVVLQMEGIARFMIYDIHCIDSLFACDDNVLEREGKGGEALSPLYGMEIRAEISELFSELCGSLRSVQCIDLFGHFHELLALQLVTAFEDEETDDTQCDREDEHQNADTEDGAGALVTGQICVVADQRQANTGQQTGNCLRCLHEKSLCGAGDRFVALAELELTVINHVSDATGCCAQRQAGTEEQECAAENNSGVAGRADITAYSQCNHGKNRKATREEVNFGTRNFAGDYREEEQTDHLKDNGKTENRIQVGFQTNLFEVVNSESLEQLSCQVEGQQQADEGDQLIVVDDDGKRLFQAGFGGSGAGGRFFLYVAYRDADTNDKQNHNDNCDGGKTSLRNIHERTV